MTRPTTEQMKKQRDEALDDFEDNRFSGMTYSEGVAAALAWALGETEELPMPEA